MKNREIVIILAGAYGTGKTTIKEAVVKMKLDDFIRGSVEFVTADTVEKVAEYFKQLNKYIPLLFIIECDHNTKIRRAMAAGKVAGDKLEKLVEDRSFADISPFAIERINSEPIKGMEENENIMRCAEELKDAIMKTVINFGLTKKNEVTE